MAVLGSKRTMIKGITSSLRALNYRSKTKTFLKGKIKLFLAAQPKRTHLTKIPSF
jgi:hypothetical protein